MKRIIFLFLILAGPVFSIEQPVFPARFHQLPKKVVLLNDTSAWYHWGCTGTTSAIKAQIVMKGYNLSCIPIQYNYTLKDFPLQAEEFDDQEIFEKFKQSNGRLIAELESADIVMVNGEGTLHGLRPGPVKLLYVTYISKKFLNKQVQIIAHSVFPDDTVELKDPVAVALYEKVYKAVDFVAVREKQSAHVMEQMGIAAVQSFDCLPLYIRSYYLTSKQPANTIVIGGSVAWEEQGMLAVIEYMKAMKQKGFDIHVVIGAQQDGAADDERLVKFLEPHAGIYELVRAETIDQWLDEINNAALVVSGRFHYSIAAGSLGTPFIALNSNTPKVQALADFIPSEKEVLAYTDPDLLEKLFDQSEKCLSEERIDVLDTLCHYAEQNFRGL
jgi:polysaccharide pyruvyl transferase WcaK-like protein